MGKGRKNHWALSCWRIDLGNWARNWEQSHQVHTLIVSHFNLLINEIHTLGFLFQIVPLCSWINVLMFHQYECYLFDCTDLFSSLVVGFMCRWTHERSKNIVKASSSRIYERMVFSFQVDHKLSYLFMYNWMNAFY